MLTIQDVIFDNNATSCVGPNCGSFTHSAGAVFVGNDGDVLIQRTIFRHNMAGCVGQKCTSGPAALYIDDIGPGSSQNNAVTIENSSFFSNTGGCASVSCYQGGMMDLNAIFTITFQNVTVRSNRLVCQALDCHVDEIFGH